jgi:hypothetical protein
MRIGSRPSFSAGMGVTLAILLIATASHAVAQAEAEPAPDLGATFGLFEDDFSQVGLWGQTSDERGTLENDGGSYRITLTEADASLWTWVGFPGKDDAWRMEADVTLEAGPGAGGLMCGSDADPDDFLVGVVNGANEWALLNIHDSMSSLVVGGQLPAGIDLSAGGTTRLGLDCAVTGTEADQVRLWADGQLLGTQEAAPRIGPFNVAGLFATSPSTPWSAGFDDFQLRYGLGYRAPPVSTLGATRLAVTDDFSDPGGWDTPTSDVGAIRYDDQTLLIDLTAPDGHLWSWRDLSSASPALRVEGTVDLEGSGAAGFMCGANPEEPEFLVGVATSDSGWRILRFVAGQTTEIAHGLLPDGVDPAAGPVMMALECASLPGEGARVAMWADGRFAGATSAVPSAAPYLLVGIYGISTDASLAAHVDDLKVSAGLAYDPVPEP